jgi:hypothetical protein
LLVAPVAFGPSLAWHSIWTRHARADQVSDLMNESGAGPSSGGQCCSCDSVRATYETTPPELAPTPGVAPCVGQMVQLVNESNVTLLAASSQGAGRNAKRSGSSARGRLSTKLLAFTGFSVECESGGEVLSRRRWSSANCGVDARQVERGRR